MSKDLIHCYTMTQHHVTLQCHLTMSLQNTTCQNTITGHKTVSHMQSLYNCITQDNFLFKTINQIK